MSDYLLHFGDFQKRKVKNETSTGAGHRKHLFTET